MSSQDVLTLDELISLLDSSEPVEAPAEQWATVRATVFRVRDEMSSRSDELVQLEAQSVVLRQDAQRLVDEAKALREESARLRDERNKLRELSTQLQTALVSRVLIEQAKGMIAVQTGTSIDAAFQILRKYARDHNERIHDVAGAVVERRMRL